MKRWLILPVLVVGALALTAIGLADPGHGHNKPNAKGGKLVFHVTTTDHGCSFRAWATDTLRRVYKVRRNDDGSYMLCLDGPRQSRLGASDGTTPHVQNLNPNNQGVRKMAKKDES